MKQPNFEQYKRDQKKIEKIPTIKADFHFVLNDIAKKLLEGVEISPKEVGDLEIVYILTQGLEKELVNYLDGYRAQAIISKIEFLITTDYFLTANQNGPDSQDVKNSLMEAKVAPDEFDGYMEKVEIPKSTKSVISSTYTKIKDKKG